MIQRIAQFVRDVLTPASNTPSFGRFMSLLISAFVLGWDTAYVVFAWHMNHHLPAGYPPLDLLPSAGTLLSQAGFMTVFYGVTKYGDLKSAQQESPAAPPTQNPSTT